MCYSWWCLSALSILNRLHWIDRDALSNFILECQVRSRQCFFSTALDQCLLPVTMKQAVTIIYDVIC